MKQPAQNSPSRHLARAEHANSRPSRKSSTTGNHLSQLAAMMNGGVQSDSLVQLKDAIQHSACVQRLQATGTEINRGAPARSSGVPINNDAGLEREADTMGTKALTFASPPVIGGAPEVRHHEMPRARVAGDVSWGATQLQESGTCVIQLELNPEQLKDLVARATPALVQGGPVSPPNGIKQAYKDHGSVAGDLENQWMAKCLTKTGDALAALDPRIQHALSASPSFIQSVSVLANRIWTSEIATAFHEGLMGRLHSAVLTQEGMGEFIQLTAALPEASWKTDEFATLDKIEEAARSKTSLDEAYGAYSSFVDLVRIRAFHARFHPPADIATSATPTAGAKRAHFTVKTTGYGVPSTSPELVEFLRDPVFAGVHRENRERSKLEFHKDDVVFVPIGSVANADGEVLVKFARSSSYVPFANLAIDPAPQTGNLNPLNAVPLFPLGGPSPADVGQQALGDCFFLAGLASIAHSKPAVIRDVVKDRGNSVYAVRFFAKRTLAGKPSSFHPEWVAVNSEVYVDDEGHPIYAKGNTALWPAIVEKAYAAWKGRGSYEAITGGFSNEAFEQVLGSKAEKLDVQALNTVEGALGTGTYSKQAIELFKKIGQATRSGKPVALDTKEWGSGGTGLSGGENITEKPGLASSHAYSVFATKGTPGTDKYLYVTVRNPWGHFGRGYDVTGWVQKSLRAKEVEAGVFDLELSDLMRYSSNVHFG